MTKRGVIRLFSVGAGVAVICVAKYISNKGVEATLEQIKNSRADYDADIFGEYENVSRAAEAIILKETIEEDKQREVIKHAYNAADKKVQDILAKERALSQAEYKAASEAFDSVEVRVAAIKATEEALIKDVLKNDDVYEALNSARNAVLKTGESTDKIDIKIENRKEAIRKGIISARSEEDNATFRELDRLRRTMVDSTGREASIIASRTDEEKKAFTDLEKCRKRLRSTNDLRAAIKENRSDEEVRIFERKDELLREIVEIEERERKSVDHNQAFADQLKSMGFSKTGVFVVGLVPTIPVFMFVGDYISWLVGIVKKM